MEYIKLQRNLISKLSEPLTLKVFVTLLLLSENGQAKTSVAELGIITRATNKQLRTRLKNLEDMGLIQRVATNHFSVIHICNIEDYVVD